MRFHPALFNQGISSGPSGPSYDEVLLDMDLILQVDDGFESVVWATPTELVDNNLGSEDNYGVKYVDAWIIESGYANSYDTLINDAVYELVFQIDDVFDSVTWPTKSAVESGDLGSDANNGAVWLSSWFNESGYAPTDYNVYSEEAVMDSVFFVPADTISVV